MRKKQYNYNSELKSTTETTDLVHILIENYP